ncbi:MAG TPA: diguanylate cyclase [Pirellulales bacterium]
MAVATGSLLILGIVVVVLVSLAMGVLVGWHLRGFRGGAVDAPLTTAAKRTSPAAPSPAQPANLQAEQAKALLDQLLRLTDRATAGMGAHSSRVEKISQELSATSADGKPLEQVILGAAQQLLQANEILRTELDAAKGQVQDHAKKIESSMAEARTDGLCGVANRRAFDEELTRRCAALREKGEKFSLILVDIDHFKRFNDLHGHQAGDEVLRAVGRVFAENVRDCDFVARYGGEEFAIIVPDTSFHEAQAIAEQLRSSLAASHVDYQGKTLQVTASLGVAEAKDGLGVEAVIQGADQALYAAKQNGRNCSYFFNGKTCEHIDPTWFEKNQDMLEAVERQLDEEQATGTPIDRRNQPRRPFPTNQFVAPYVEGRLPTRETFVQVRCHDISSGGFSFLLPQPPDFDLFVVALGMPPNVTYLTGRVMHTTPSPPGHESQFLVGCRFTGRVELNIECVDRSLEVSQT